MMSHGFDAERQAMRGWMETQEEPLATSTMDGRISNCNWIEKHLGYSSLPYSTLSEAYEADGLFDIFQFLMYSSDHVLASEINGNLKTNLSTYRSALTLYMEYKQGIKHDKRNQCKYEAASFIELEDGENDINGMFVDDTRIEVGNGDIAQLWMDYRNKRKAITDAIGRSSSIEAEISELAVAVLHNGFQLKGSAKSADVITSDGVRIQVKSRVPRQGDTTKLGVIRSWDFDVLAIIIFTEDGEIDYAIELDADVAKEYASSDERINGQSISTTKAFRNDPRLRYRTKEYQEIIQML